MSLCIGTGKAPIKTDEDLVCSGCYSSVPYVMVGGDKDRYLVAQPHTERSGLEYRCILCFQPPFRQYHWVCRLCSGAGCDGCDGVGEEWRKKATECSAEKHSLVVYPFRCETCGGAVKVLGEQVVGDCEVSYDHRHSLNSPLSPKTVSMSAPMPIAKPYIGMGKWSGGRERRCLSCNTRLTGRDGTTKCRLCLSQGK